MTARFTLYDVIGVLVPGVFLLWGLVTATESPTLQSLFRLSGGLTDTSVLVVVGYVAGLLVHGFAREGTERVLLWRWGGFPSARWLLPSDQRFSPQRKAELAAAIRAKFNLDVVPPDQPAADARQHRKIQMRRNQEVFCLCYRAVEKQSELPQIFNAQYGLFRSLLTIFAMVAIVGFVRLGADPGASYSSIAQYSPWVALLGMVASSWQVRKRGEDFAQAVYDQFLVHFPPPR